MHKNLHLAILYSLFSQQSAAQIYTILDFEKIYLSALDRLLIIAKLFQPYWKVLYTKIKSISFYLTYLFRI